MNDWDLCPLGEVTINFDSQRIPVKELDRVSGPYPYYGASGIIDWVNDYIFDGEYLLIAEDGENLKTRKTPIAFMANGKIWVNNHAHIVQGNERALTKFLYYAINGLDVTPYLTGSTFPKLTKANLNNIRLIVPPLDEQRSIAHILGTLDDKIELNHRMNETLEAIARAIFKSWFIDFDPVRAKAEGKQPFGMDEETAALFPSEFEDSELGEIPKGWAIGYLSHYAENPRRGIEPTEIAPETPYFGLEHMPRGSISLSDWGAAETISSNKFIFRQGEILFGKLRPYFRKVGVAPIDGVCSTDIFVLRPRRREYGEFVLMWASDQRFIDHCNAVSNGARMPRVNWKDMGSYPFVAPQDSILEKYHQIIRPMVEQIIQNIHLSRTLHELRDALLPKLLSGEIRVPMEAD